MSMNVPAIDRQYVQRAKAVAATRGREGVPGREVGEAAPVLPDESWTKAQIQESLDKDGIEYPASATKADLLELARE